jgi:GT2 family glycosyltransferase
MDLTIVIPVFEKLEIVEKFAEGNKEILSKYLTIVINKGGGESLKVSSLFQQNTTFWFARRFGLEFVSTKYVLCLDVDTILPPQYIEQAIEILEKSQNVGAVALYYSNTKQDHAAFGTSIWRTHELRDLYDWRIGFPPVDMNMCECKYMWKKLEKTGKKVEVLLIQALHLKSNS